MNGAIVNSCFSCFADCYGSWGDTLKAFIFSLTNSEGLQPFKCFAENERKAIYESSDYGPSFGEGPFLRIFGKSAQQSMAVIRNPYSVPNEVRKWSVLIEPFPLIMLKCSTSPKPVLEKKTKNKKKNKQKTKQNKTNETKQNKKKN